MLKFLASFHGSGGNEQSGRDSRLSSHCSQVQEIVCITVIESKYDGGNSYFARTQQFHSFGKIHNAIMCLQEEDLAPKSFGRYSHRVRAIRYQVMGQNEHRILPPPAAEPIPPDNPRRAKKERIHAEFPRGTAALAVRPILHTMGDGLVQLHEVWGENSVDPLSHLFGCACSASSGQARCCLQQQIVRYQISLKRKS